MIDLIHDARRLQDFLESKNWNFCFIGGLAVQLWGNPRLTTDIDVTVLTGFDREESFVDEFLKTYQPRRSDAKAFALTNRVLLLKSDSNTGIDVSLGAIPFEGLVVKRSKNIEVIPGLHLRLCTPEDLVVLKAFAARDIDWMDVQGVVTRQGSKALDWKYVFEQLTPLTQLKEQPEILTKLRKIQEA